MSGTSDGAPSKDDQRRMWDMITAYRISQIVGVAARYSLADHLDAGCDTAEGIAAAEGTTADAMGRLLRAGVPLGLTTVDGKRFAATPLLRTLGKDGAASMRSLAVAMTEPGHWLPWGKLHDAVRTGEPQTTATLGSDLWTYLDRTPAEAVYFNGGMAGMRAALGEESGDIIDTRTAGVLVDVGGGNGSLAHTLMRANPDLHAIVFDQPRSVPGARRLAAELGLADRLTVMGGDFMESVPEGDTFALRYILHDWSDEVCIRILANCRAAMRPGGRVLVLEMVIDDEAPSRVVTIRDIGMLVVTSGRERTLDEFARLFEQAGLSFVRATPTGTPLMVIEAVAA